MVISGCVEYSVSEGHDEKSGCRVLFTGPAINSGVIDLNKSMNKKFIDRKIPYTNSEVSNATK